MAFEYESQSTNFSWGLSGKLPTKAGTLTLLKLKDLMKQISSLIVAAAALVFVLPLFCVANAGRVIDQRRPDPTVRASKPFDLNTKREPYAGEWSNGRGETLVRKYDKIRERQSG